MKALIEGVEVRMQVSSWKREFENDCKGEAKIYFSDMVLFVLQEGPI